MRIALPLIPLLLAVGSCASPPKPPTIDEALRRPVNSKTAIELQVCQGDLQNTRIGAGEAGRLASTAAAHQKRTAMCLQALDAVSVAESGNSVFTVRFAFGSTRVVVPAGAAAALLDQARVAPLIVLRGRTDGTADSAAESRIARERAMAVRDHLVGSGVDPARIRVTYQPTGDHAGDNTSAAGRAMNRRVEIELYRDLPIAMAGGQ